MKKGQITAFLSLIFVLLVSFILAMTESAFIQVSKNRKRLDADRAVFSVFGEYQKILLEEYGVFAFDASYGTGRFEEDRILNRLNYYGASQIGQEIEELQLLTDNNGQAFRDQVITYMEQSKGLSALRQVTGLAAQWEERKIQGQELSGELDETLGDESGLLPEEAEELLSSRRTGLLALVLPRSFSLSPKTLRLEEQVSRRQKTVGRGTFPMRAESMAEETLLFGQYILEHFGSAVDRKSEERTLDYEVEYLLFGKESDADNLKSVINCLLPVRFSMNYLYLMSDTKKQEEAEALALGISVLLLNPEAVEIIKQILLLLWSFGESVLDIRVLLSGKKSAFVKNEESWQLKLSSLFSLGKAEDNLDGQEAEEGLDYRQYLRILLFLKDSGQLTMRTLDRVEQNLKHKSGLDFFRADACVTKIKLKNTAEIWNGVTYTFPVFYGYL